MHFVKRIKCARSDFYSHGGSAFSVSCRVLTVFIYDVTCFVMVFQHSAMLVNICAMVELQFCLQKQKDVRSKLHNDKPTRMNAFVGVAFVFVCVVFFHYTTSTKYG